MTSKLFSAILLLVLLTSCNKSEDEYEVIPEYLAVKAAFGDSVDLENLYNYANQDVPDYITKDNSNGNAITDKGATLGRVLFYDVNLSSNNTISCASCHIQSVAFGDSEVASIGVNGSTNRHSMRLINSKFADESKYFWDERAVNLEVQTTMPIKDHGEMGFSGENGDPDFDALIQKLSDIDYYKELFHFVYGNEEITEAKMQFALAQFVRSIQSFDSKYDAGRALASNDMQPFSNFTAQENFGKNLFMTPPIFNRQSSRTGGGYGCATCHRAPEFDIDPNSLNNGFFTSMDGSSDPFNTRSPSLRDLFNNENVLNGPMMHTGILTSFQSVIVHYGNMTNQVLVNPNLDPRLKPENIGQRLNFNAEEIAAITAFMQTLTGSNVYTDEKWSNPF
uniref:cytochrome-c peroxidase n=2 Tax=Flavobacterium sp. TaxID=239 RepID=UPI004049B61C